MTNTAARRIWVLLILGLVLTIFKSAGILHLPWVLVFTPFLLILIFLFLVWYRLYRNLLKDSKKPKPTTDMGNYNKKVAKNLEGLSTIAQLIYLCRTVKDIRKKRITKL